MPSMSWRAMEIASRLLLRRADLRVEGIEHVPSNGPVVIAARHYHHLYDGPALICALGRPISIVIALDWIKQRPLRRLMQRLCDQLDWPTVIRPDRSGQPPTAEARATLRQASQQTVKLLRRHAIVVIFPE